MMREIKCNCGTIILTDSTIKKYDTKTKQNKKIYAIIDGKEFTEEEYFDHLKKMFSCAYDMMEIMKDEGIENFVKSKFRK